MPRHWDSIAYYPRFVAKTCADGAHRMVRAADGARRWECVNCEHSRDFHRPADT